MAVRILVFGGYDPDEKDAKDVQAFGRALGAQIIKQGQTLISGTFTDFDRDVAKGAHDELTAGGVEDMEARLRSYVPKGGKANHDFGKLIRSRLKNWDPGSGPPFIPEPISNADVVIVVKGFKATFRAAFWASYAKKPLLPVAYFGGAARELYEKEMDDFDNKYSGLIDRDKYEELNAYSEDWEERAAYVVSLSEDIAVSSTVTVLMSYSEEPQMKKWLDNVYLIYQRVCEGFGYEAKRIDETSEIEDIVPAILASIEQSAFVIADLTEVKPNVLYELGHAKGQGKRVIVTAHEATTLPFDVKDFATTFWDPEDAKTLEEKLEVKVKQIADKQGWVEADEH